MSCRNVSVAVALVIGVAAQTRAGSLQFVDNLPGEFIDISPTATPLNLGDDGEVALGSSVGNFVFPTGEIIVASNGGVAFANPPSSELFPDNSPIPGSAAFGGGQGVLPFWDDIDDKDGDVYSAQFGDMLIVQWHNVSLANSPGSTVRFQVQIFGGVGPGGVVAQYLFDDIEQPGAAGGLSASIGYQDGEAGFGDVQWSFNTAGAVMNGTVLSLVAPEPGTLVLLALVGPALLRRRR